MSTSPTLTGQSPTWPTSLFLNRRLIGLPGRSLGFVASYAAGKSYRLRCFTLYWSAMQNFQRLGPFVRPMTMAIPDACRVHHLSPISGTYMRMKRKWSCLREVATRDSMQNGVLQGNEYSIVYGLNWMENDHDEKWGQQKQWISARRTCCYVLFPIALGAVAWIHACCCLLRTPRSAYDLRRNDMASDNRVILWEYREQMRVSSWPFMARYHPFFLGDPDRWRFGKVEYEHLRP